MGLAMGDELLDVGIPALGGVEREIALAPGGQVPELLDRSLSRPVPSAIGVVVAPFWWHLDQQGDAPFQTLAAMVIEPADAFNPAIAEDDISASNPGIETKNTGRPDVMAGGQDIWERQGRKITSKGH